MKPEKLAQLDCSKHKPKQPCRFKDCPNMVKSNGKCPKCGKHRYHNYCWKGTLKH